MLTLGRSEVLLKVVRPSLKELGLLKPALDNPDAELLLMAIGEHESLGWKHPVQVVKQAGVLIYAPHIARGWWQCEKTGAVDGVMKHRATAAMAQTICAQHRIEFDRNDIHDALAWEAHFAAKWARLNLWWLPRKLPAPGATHEALEQYVEAWRPGAWERDPTGVRQKWVSQSYPAALAVCEAHPRTPA